MTFIVQTSFKAKSGEIRKGQIVAMPEDKAEVLLRAGKIRELRACHVCHADPWWLSVHGVLVCGACHPPPAPDLVKRWIASNEPASSG